MKRTLLFLTFVMALAAPVIAATYRVADIPDVHTADRSRFVSNPDGILTSRTQAVLDSIIADVWDRTSVELTVVVVDNIEPADIQDFATDLFTLWGIGKKDKDNGLLVLVAKEMRQAVIRTGYGVEGVVPDILAGQIIRHEMAPEFSRGDYDTGAIKAIGKLHDVLVDPEVRDELMSAYANDAADERSDDKLFRLYLTGCAIMSVVLLALVLAGWFMSRGKSDFARYSSLNRLSTGVLLLTFAGLGMPLIAYIPLRLMLRHLRRGPHPCPNCSTMMNLVDEEHDNDYLTPAQDTEERINSIDYDVWLCPNCGETDIYPYVNRTASFVECPYCHGRTAQLTSDRVTRQPTATTTGEGTKTFECRNCGNRHFKKYSIPKAAPVVIIGGGGGNGHFGGGGFSGGSFGGGMTGGGGARGGW